MTGFTVALLLIAAAPMPAPALSPQAQESFKAWFSKGESLYAEGEYGAAIFAFQQAEKLRATPEVAFDLARAHEKLGDSAFSTFYYRLYLRRAPIASDALEVASVLGSTLAQAESSGTGLLEVDGSEQAQLSIDGVSYPEFPVAVFLPPGAHDVVASFPTGLQRRTAQIVKGKVTAVQLDRVPPPLIAYGNEPVSSSWAASSSKDPAVAAVSANGSSSPKPLLHKASYGLVGAGVAAFAVGGVFGALAGSDRGRLSNDKTNLTVSQGRALADAAAGKASTANALFVTGALAAVAGGLLFTFTLPEPGATSAGGASP